MKKSRFTEEQIAFAPKQAELGTSVPDVCCTLGISDAAFTLGVRNTAEFPLLNSNIYGNWKRNICG